MSRARAWKPVLAAAGACLALLATELAHRVWLRAHGTPFDRAQLEERLARMRDTTAAFTPGAGAGAVRGKARDFGILHPFYGSEIHHDTGDVLRRFRTRTVDDSEYVVLVVGGSVAASWAQDVNDAFKLRLEADSKLGGRTVHVLGFAHAGYKQPQQVTRLAYLFSFGYAPDAVINLDGFNELASSVSNASEGTNPNYPSGSSWAALLRDRRDLDAGALDALVDFRAARNDVVAGIDAALSSRLTSSSLFGALVERRIGAAERRASEAFGRYSAAVQRGLQDEQKRRQIHGPPFEGGLDDVIEAAAECWFQGSLSLRALCEERGIHYLHCLQPTLFDPGSKIVSPEEEAIGNGPPGWRQAIVQGYPKLRERSAELVRRGVRFHDVSRVFADVEKTLYYDPCHFHGQGNKLLTRVIAERFLADLPDPPRPR